MDQREDVLRQALDKNAAETERWQAFKEDNVNTIKNLDNFVKQQTVDIMVPIGKKALMAGQLVHTNELLVGHYEGYFSTCSAHKAKEICGHRLGLAEKHLKELETEADLWQNKLQTPIREGAVPNSDEIEIVEDYDEESHKKWLEEHKQSVRNEKKEERLKREALDAKDDEFLKKLEEREMLEELGLDPDNLNEDALRNILSSESETKPTPASAPQTISDEREAEMWARLEAQEREEISEMGDNEENSVKSTDEIVRKLISGEMDVTNEKKRRGKKDNHVENHSPKEESNHEADQPEELDDLPEEVNTIREQLDVLPREEHEQFLRTQLNLLKAKMRKIQSVHFICDELTHLMNVVVALEDDLQELIFEREQESSSEDNVSEGEAIADEPIPEPATIKRRISFAPAEQRLEFRKEDAVADMIPKSKAKEQHQAPREVITLDMPEPTKPGKANSNSHIIQKVEQNIELVQEQQSIQDFDLVNQILDGMTGRINTLHINFTHSDAKPAERDVSSTDKVDIPGTPADFYRIYESSKARAENQFPIYVNGFEGEEEVKVALLGEAARATAYEDPKTQMTKSILRNKTAVEREPHMTNPTKTKSIINQNQNQKKKSKKNKKKKERTIDDELREMSAYKKVMSDDLVEKEPEGKFVETHAPRRRVSRFKAQRAAFK
ncbi:uncharacterized protein Dwil_GK17110 [Drosophila willistoni]|uniref:DUF3835 domain-containing protein n=1 Tax=Drosophila willistoni TaxID=7260 RepID=B4MND1_DROWI|nr:unconventional prefoldin RPB5 interactor-like protein [Drosophila willistoni]EDW72640.1 uncharacterized protein Dwil_GK17110 [Drosophila willistoni]